MKKLLAIAVALTAFVAVAAAQPRALGVRFGSPSFNPGFGAELSYQHGLGTTNFIGIIRCKVFIMRTWRNRQTR